MAQRLKANEFIGHEIESILALDDSVGKELVIVSVITAGDVIPKSFYRVKEKGNEPVDYEEWCAAVDYYNCIREMKHQEEKNTGIAKVEITTGPDIQLTQEKLK